MRQTVQEEYFKWLTNLVCEGRYSNKVSYNKLLRFLHDTDFRYSIMKDENRAEDGLGLRYSFGLEYAGVDAANMYLDQPCSVLEMMIALARRCEMDIMDDATIGNRMAQWFWGMVVNLGLGSMTDEFFDIKEAEYIVYRFLSREYESDGRGGLFTVRDCEYDMRDIEIWHQLCYFLDTIA